MDILDLNYDFFNSSFNLDENVIEIFAHPNEKLYLHLEKTKFVFNYLLNEEIICFFYQFLYANEYINLNFKDFEDLLNHVVLGHDIAKISFNFQRKLYENEIRKISKKIQKNNNHDLKNKLNTIKNDYNIFLNVLKEHDSKNSLNNIESNHSLLSALLTFYNFFKSYEIKSNKSLSILFYMIYGHHTTIKNISNDENFSFGLIGNEKFTLQLFLRYLNISFKPKKYRNLQKLQKNFYEDLEKIQKDHNTRNSIISFFYSYIYSLLITSDVIASNYSNETINYVKEHVNEWNNRIQSDLYDEMNSGFNNKSNQFKKYSYQKINTLREKMMNESLSNLQNALKHDDSHIFYLNIPTGGGKTNTSMKLALEILKQTNADRLIYAMPFINIIDQNYEVIHDTFIGVSDFDFKNMRKIYSSSETILENKNDDDKSEILLKDDFFDYPIICTTFVTFFNSIIQNKKKYKYALSAMANSVVILDEIQSLPLKNWTSLYYLINEISKNYNIYFIIMSATLPKFDDLKINNREKISSNNINLITNPKKYFSDNLFQRTKIIDPIKEINVDDEDECFDYFHKIFSKNFYNEYKHGLIVVNTVKTSKLIYQYLNKMKEESDLDFEIDLLNSTILSSKRKEIINKINNFNENQLDPNYILVSTQSVEAGVDVSFDFVVRDLAILDSIEQVRGRCNRSRELNDKFGEKDENDEDIKGNVYLIKIKRNNKWDYTNIYKKEEYEIRFKETEKILKENLNYDYNDILKYYNAVSESINKNQGEKYENLIENDSKNIEHWNRCIYSKIQDKINGIHIIQNQFQNYSFFVPVKQNIFIEIPEIFNDLEINIENQDVNEIKNLLSECEKHLRMQNIKNDELEKIMVDFKKKFIFSVNELRYLKEKELKYNLNLFNENKVDGSKLLKIYNIIFKEINNDLGKKKIFEKEFSSILDKFIFNASVFNFEKLNSVFNFKQYGYFYVITSDFIKDDDESPEDLYSLKTGFNFNYGVDEHDFEIL
ncbi:MAG: CRISPR-associated helicase Cas3' [Methanobrevibacter sp.]|jgi:CRISPR-associated endonuclease/helicase Cas3|nr:CRISPR-associated helicase Cas3' [Candidatus Methanoflexus mossambicus]